MGVLGLNTVVSNPLLVIALPLKEVVAVLLPNSGGANTKLVTAFLSSKKFIRFIPSALVLFTKLTA